MSFKRQSMKTNTVRRLYGGSFARANRIARCSHVGVMARVRILRLAGLVRSFNWQMFTFLQMFSVIYLNESFRQNWYGGSCGTE